MANNPKKYAGESALSALVTKIKELFVSKTDFNSSLSNKADKSHTHSISDTTNLQSTLDAKVPTSRTINNKALTANVTLSASDVGAAPSSVQTTLNAVSDTLNAHTGNSDIHFTADERTKLSGIAAGAQVNTITGVKGNSESTYRTGNVNITKANIGLGNVDNTSDANKPISTAQQTAFDAVNDAIDTHKNNGDIHVTTTNKTNWNAAHTHSTSAHARTDATKVEDSSTNGNIKINGTETNVYSHPTSGVTAGTYKSVTVNAQGHVTGGSNPTTLAGFGITDGALKTDVTNHNTSTSAHGDIRDSIEELTTKLNNFLDVDDTTTDQLSELLGLIEDNATDIESITNGKVNVSDIINNLTTNVTNKPLSAAQGVEIKRLIDALDSALDTHDANTTKHITSTERTNWNAAKTHADSAHAPSDAQKNQNAFSNVKVGSTTIAADTTTDTLTLEGSNVTITPDATNDKVTIAVADATTSAKGVVQLSDSVTSDSSTTAATSYSVRAAHKLAGQAYDLANSKADYTHNHTVSQIGDLTVSASELNYMDGVTSNVQAQLDGKQSSITGGASTIASSNLTANRALVSNANGKVGVSLVTATELGYLDGVTSNIQDQLDDKAAYSHNHSAAHITSGIMDAARLPDASETAAGIVNTETQSFAGNKTFTGKVTAAGVASNGHITAGTANTYDIGTSLSPFKRIYTQDLYVDAKVVAGSVLDGGSFVKETDGTTTTKGITRLTVGNYIAKGKNGNAEGRITIYNENNGSVTLRTSHTDSDTPTIFLPDHMGTLVTEDDIAGLASVATVTTAEYTALEEAEATNANTLYIITDAEEETIPQIQFVTWEEND